MANQPETSLFAAGIYQWEVVDPVQGGINGIANLPLLQLASRTKYLYDAVGGLTTLVGTKAPIDSPNLTGSPKAPTPPGAAGGLEIVNAAWVRTAISGALVITLTGPRSLTSAEAANGLLELGGSLTVATPLLMPGGGRWTIVNRTNQAIIVSNAGGTATSTVTISSAHTQTLCSDGASMFGAFTDFDSVNLTGAPTTTTPAAGDNTLRIPNTAWIQQLFSSLTTGTNVSNAALQAALNNEALIRAQADTALQNQRNADLVALNNNLAGAISTEAQSRLAGDNSVLASLTAAINSEAGTRNTGDTNEATARNNADVAIYAAVAATYPTKAQFGVSLLGYGYQLLPGGLILQWGTGATTGGLDGHNFPTPFPNGQVLTLVAGEGASLGWNNPPTFCTVMGTNVISASQFYLSAVQIAQGGTISYGAGISYRWFAVGF